jgi:pimeloyl-ACP methyl ester carboxylesterase
MTFDHRDVGQSERSLRPYTTADMAGDVAGWLAASGSRPAHVVGHSLGGLVAQELGLRHPEIVKSLILVSSRARPDDWVKAVIESWVILKRHVSDPGFTRAVLPWLVGPPFFRQAAHVEGLVQYAERHPWPQDAEAFARQAQAAAAHDTYDRLGALRVRCLVLAGEHDLVNPPAASRELAERIPGAAAVFLPGVGHLPHVEDPLRFRLEVERFLERVDG